jgi:hypothetical protein
VAVGSGLGAIGGGGQPNGPRACNSHPVLFGAQIRLLGEMVKSELQTRDPFGLVYLERGTPVPHLC